MQLREGTALTPEAQPTPAEAAPVGGARVKSGFVFPIRHAGAPC
jgi:hypothetical protein